MKRIEKLFEPIKIGKMELKNRIVMPPMATNFANADGSVSDRLINYYVERVEGGVGLLIVEATAVDPSGLVPSTQLRIHHHRFIPGLFRLVEAIHRHGGKCAIQLLHPGRQAYSHIIGKQVVAPSAIPCPVFGEMPKELTIEEIEDLVEAFGEGALRAKMARFDAVEIHGAHGYLINQFLSPRTNRRADKYGGDLENRMRFALEIVERTKEKVGTDFPLLFRLSGDDYVEGGFTLKESKEFAKKLEDTGVDALHLSAGGWEALTKGEVITVMPTYLPRGSLVYLAEEIKKAVNIPVIAVGSITPEMAEDIIRDGRADLVSMGRGLIADSQIPRKLVEGRLNDIRICIRCNEGCIGRRPFLPITCAINASVGKEEEYRIMPTRKPKKVLIVGGGVAGLEAARVTALRGHKTILVEKEPELGGQVLIAAQHIGKKDLKHFVDWLSLQCRKAGVKIELYKEATPELVKELNPDVVIVATGGIPLIPQIPGVRRKNVFSFNDVLTGKAVIGKKVAVVGAGSVGAETAYHLAEKGHDVTIITRRAATDMAIDLPRINRAYLLTKLAEKVKTIENSLTEEITDKGIVATDKQGNRKIVECDGVILAWGLVPNKALYVSLKGEVSELYSIGDCVEPRKIMDAVGEASYIARQI